MLCQAKWKLLPAKTTCGNSVYGTEIMTASTNRHGRLGDSRSNLCHTSYKIPRHSHNVRHNAHTIREIKMFNI